jgi:hypothetical protein
LGKIIAGVTQDQGELLRGTPVAFGSPRQALERGTRRGPEVALVRG